MSDILRGINSLFLAPVALYNKIAVKSLFSVKVLALGYSLIKKLYTSLNLIGLEPLIIF